MAILKNFEERRESEHQHSVDPKYQTLQGCHHKRIRGPRGIKGNYYVWLVESINYDTSLYSKRTFQEESMRNGMKCVKGDGKDQGIYRQEAGRYGTYSDLETTKHTFLGMTLFKDIHPAIPLEQQINTKYKDPLFDEYAIVSTLVEGGIDVWPKEATKVHEENKNVEPESIPEIKSEDLPKQEPEHYELTEKNRAFFERDQISHNERPILSDRQKEIMLAHLFDKKVLVIDGGPGTGKSTTMIQRLKLLLSNEFYSDKEYANFNFKHGTNWNLLQTIYSDFLKQELEKKENNKLWMFFSPTSQLNSFLRSSLEKEGLQYPEQSTKIWLEKHNSAYRGYCLELGRDYYKFSRNITIDTRSNANLNINPQQDYKAFENTLLNILNDKFSITCKDILQKAEQANISKNDLEDLSTPFANIESLFIKNSTKFHTKEFFSKNIEGFVNRLTNNIDHIISKEAKSLDNGEIIFWTICFLKLRFNNSELYKEIVAQTQQNNILVSEKSIENIFSLFTTSIGKDHNFSLSTYLLELQSLPEQKDLKVTIDTINIYKGIDKIKENPAALKDLNLLTSENNFVTKNVTDFFRSLFGNLVRKSVEYYITSKGIRNDYGLYNFIKSALAQEWSTIQEIESLYTKALSNETKKLFDEYIQDTYENIYRKERFHYEPSDKLQFQEISFLIYAGNKLAEKLYKLCKTEFDSILARPKDSTHYDVIGGYSEAWRIVIGIDEATDFVPIELAAMASLQHPEHGCVTLSGDQMQCFNNDGIKDWKQLEKDIFDFGSDIISLDISYRQTPSLLNMAKKIYRRNTGKEAPYNPYISSYENEPQPLLFKSDDDDEKTTWIAKRIIAMARKKRLPATAIFYPINDKNAIEEFTEQLNDIINEKGGDFTIISCFENREGEKVVVYPLNLVKGLEFEAAFFFNLDQIADPTMQERFLYVGLSRATFYLGATSSSNWDTELSKDFEQDLSKSNWPCLESEKPAPPPKDNNVPPPAPKNEVPSAKTVDLSQNIVTQSNASIQPAIKPSNPQFISPLDWAKEHDVNVDTVVKFLRETGIRITSMFTKISAAHYATILDRIENGNVKSELLSPKPTNNNTLTEPSIIDAYGNIKPIDWAKAHGLKADVVMKLLRDAGVRVLTQVSKVNAKEYKKIEAYAEMERQKAEARAKRLGIPSPSMQNPNSNGKLKVKLLKAKLYRPSK